MNKRSSPMKFNNVQSQQISKGGQYRTKTPSNARRSSMSYKSDGKRGGPTHVIAKPISVWGLMPRRHEMAMHADASRRM